MSGVNNNLIVTVGTYNSQKNESRIFFWSPTELLGGYSLTENVGPFKAIHPMDDPIGKTHLFYMDINGTNIARLMKLQYIDWYKNKHFLQELDFGRSWNTSLKMSIVNYKTNGKFYFFHHSPKEVEVTRDFERSFRFAFDEEIDTIHISSSHLIFSKKEEKNYQRKFFSFSEAYTAQVFDALLKNI